MLDEVAGSTSSSTATRGVQRAPKFDPVYGSSAATNAQAYKDSIGTAADRPTMQPASAWKKDGKTGSKVATFRMSKDEILAVIAAAESAVAVDAVLGKSGSPERVTHEAQIANYVSKMVEAFDIMQIDTIEAQADFVAHSVGETLLSKLTEAQTKTFEDDPSKVSVSTDLTTNASGTILGPRRYMGNALIDPGNVITQKGGMDPSLFQKTFIGRGPIQVTDRTNYLHSLMYLDTRADALQKELDALPAGASSQRTALAAQVALLREAVDKIASDPSLAADPKYAFLFSAAMMQSSSKLREAIAGFGPTQDFTKSVGFTGGFIDDRGAVKSKAYAKAYEILSSHMTPGEFVDATYGKYPQPGPNPWNTRDIDPK